MLDQVFCKFFMKFGLCQFLLLRGQTKESSNCQLSSSNMQYIRISVSFAILQASLGLSECKTIKSGECRVSLAATDSATTSHLRQHTRGLQPFRFFNFATSTISWSLYRYSQNGRGDLVWFSLARFWKSVLQSLLLTMDFWPAQQMLRVQTFSLLLLLLFKPPSLLSAPSRRAKGARSSARKCQIKLCKKVSS